MSSDALWLIVVVLLLACCVGPAVLMMLRGRGGSGPGSCHTGPRREGTDPMSSGRAAEDE